MYNVQDYGDHYDNSVLPLMTVGLRLWCLNHFQQYFNYFVAVGVGILLTCGKHIYMIASFHYAKKFGPI